MTLQEIKLAFADAQLTNIKLTQQVAALRQEVARLTPDEPKPEQEEAADK